MLDECEMDLNPDRNTFMKYDQCLSFAVDQSMAAVGGVIVARCF